MASSTTDRRLGLTGQTAVKAPVMAATPAAITLSGLQTIDGYTTLAGDRILVRAQGDPTTNGIYNANTGAWTLDLDCNGADDIVNGTLVYIISGTTYGSAFAVASSTASPIVPGSSPLNWNINPASQQNMEWVSPGAVATFVNATTCTFPGSLVNTLHLGRRIKATVTGGTGIVYGTITVSSFGGGITTITIFADGSGAFDAGLSNFTYGIVSNLNSSDPNPNNAQVGIASAATLDLEANYGSNLTGSATITAVNLLQGKQRTLFAVNGGVVVQPGAALGTPNGRNMVAAANDRITFKALNGAVYATIDRSVYPNFMANSGVGILLSTSGSLTVVSTFAQVAVNDGLGWDGSAKFNPKVPGRYVFSVDGFVYNTSSTGLWSYNLAIAKNGTVVPSSAYGPFTGFASPFNSSGTQVQTPVSMRGIFDLNGSSDYLQVLGNTAYAGAAVQLQLSAFKIDP